MQFSFAFLYHVSFMFHTLFIPSSLSPPFDLQTLRAAITMASAPQLLPPSAPRSQSEQEKRSQSEQDRSESPAFTQDAAGFHGGTNSPHAKPRRRESAVDEDMLCAMVDAAGICFRAIVRGFLTIHTPIVF